MCQRGGRGQGKNIQKNCQRAKKYIFILDTIKTNVVSEKMDDGEPPAKVPKIEESDVKKEEVDELDEEWSSLVEKCIKALELIIQRFPDHFKAFHLLARYYIRSKVSDLKTYYLCMYIYISLG